MGGQARGPRPQADEPARGRALHLLIDEIQRLSHRLRAAGEAFHGPDVVPAPGQRVLLDLRRLGPHTVPGLARLRQVARQSVQVTVNSLADEGLVELVPNPAHQRSRLVRLTAAGRHRIDELARHEETLLAGLLPEIPTDDIHAAAGLLRALREFMDGTEWREMLEDASAGKL